MTQVLAAVLAHQGGWDEILLVAAPLSLFAGLLYLANRRADRLVQSRHDGSGLDVGPAGGAHGDDSEGDDSGGGGGDGGGGDGGGGD